jgi:pimeloyl-ACP methyl ester carboxylesterase
VAERAIDFTFHSGGLQLFGRRSGSGSPIVLLHGLTATNRYVVMGSQVLQRSGYEVFAYDARGHGRSQAPRGPDEYRYELLAADLGKLLDELGIERAVLAGASMGAHTCIRFALSHRQRVAALALIAPAYDPRRPLCGKELERWEDLATGLRQGGIDGFVRAYDFSTVPPPWRALTEQVIRQRLAEHSSLLAVADALEGVPRSQPFQAFSQLSDLAVPVLVIASRDEADPSHPLALARSYAEALPQARLVLESEGQSPLAWQGGRLSRLLAELGAQDRYRSP